MTEKLSTGALSLNTNKQNINKYILHVLSIKLRCKLYFSFSIPSPGFPHFYYMLGANLGLRLYGEVSVMEKVYVMLRCQFPGKSVPNDLQERPILGPLVLLVCGIDIPLFLCFMPDSMSVQCFFFFHFNLYVLYINTHLYVYVQLCCQVSL